MPTLSFDTGVKEYDVDGRAKLRFNPSDPELYARVLDFVDKSDEIEMRYAALKEVMTGEMDEQGFPVGGVEVVTKIRQLDRELKDTLADIFGHDNDFDAIFDHRSCLAVTDTGRNILNNFFEAIAPIIQVDTERRGELAEKLKAARTKAAGNREQRRAAAKGGQR